MSKPAQNPAAEKKEGQQQQGGGSPAPQASGGGSKAKGHSPVPGGCHAVGCKGPEKRFTFCDEHFEQFKFGLIKKTGEPVPDYEKKFEHYQAHKGRSARKAA